LSGRLAGALPQWWKLGFEIRGRADSYLGLNGIAGQDESYYLHRFRLNSTMTIRPWLRIFTQAQDSRVAEYDHRPVPGTVADNADLRQAYLDVGVNGESPWVLRVGRQPLVFGDMRLVSTSNWSNVGPNYDAVRLTHTRPGVRLDWFASLVVTPGPASTGPARRGIDSQKG
jgi:alginate export protein